MSSHKPIRSGRVLILGGGYAALAAVSTLRRLNPTAHMTVIAPRKAHIKITQLQETLRYSLRRLCVLYSELGRRFDFDFIQAKLRFDMDSLRRWQQRHCLTLSGVEIPFDHMIIATGSIPVAPDKSANALNVQDFCLNRGQTLIREVCQRGTSPLEISVVGAGATGIQFLFELSAYLKSGGHKRFTLRLVNFEQSVLGQLPRHFHDYVCERLRREGIEYLPNTAFLRQENEDIVLAHRDGKGEFRLPSHLTLQFLGVKPAPVPIETNCFGQVIADGEVLPQIFAAGDCAHFEGTGANVLSAQVAIRKGKLVAGNIHRQRAAGSRMRSYGYTEKGYIVSLGPLDAIGWLDRTENMITGLRALTLKKAAETQYDLLLGGIDTYKT